MDDNIGQFLFLLAFVIIAAIQWVVKTIQERKAPPEPEEDPLEDTWRELEEHHEAQRLEERPEPTPIRKEPGSSKTEGASPIDELRDLFASLRKPEPEQERVPAQRRAPSTPVVAVPPPLSPVPKVRERKDPRAGLSAAEKAALKRLEEAKPASRRRRSTAKAEGFRQMLRGAGNLRQALILKEVFDRPIALREESVDESFIG